MVQTYRIEREIYEKAYNELNNKSKEYTSQQEKRLKELEEVINLERDDWRKEIRKARAPGIGIFAGPAVSANGDVEVVIGAGVVWRIF